MLEDTKYGSSELQPKNAPPAGTDLDVPGLNLLDYIPLVRSIASKIYATLPPYAGLELNDLVQAGHLGLVNAGRTYQSSRRVPFAVYARFRIRGEILDSLRHFDTASRRMRRLDKRVKAARTKLTATLQRDPTDTELTEMMRLAGHPELATTDMQFLRFLSVTISSLDERDASTEDWRSASPGPETLRAEHEAQQLLYEAIDSLPARSRELIYLYYQNELSMREIGERFHVNESRVSQIHRRALEHLARYLRGIGVASSSQI